MVFLVFLLRCALSAPIRAWDDEEELQFLNEPLPPPELEGDSWTSQQDVDSHPTPSASREPTQMSTAEVNPMATVSPSLPSQALSGDSSGSGLAGGAIAGMIIGILILVGAVIAAIWFFSSRRAEPEMSSETETDQFTDSSATEPDAI
jgi:hypothetical protein